MNRLNGLNLSKRSRLPYCPLPDVHNAPRRPPRPDLGIFGPPAAIAGAEGTEGTDPTSYAGGYIAGERWACELAGFTELEQLERDAAAPYIVAPPFLRGFIDGALATWHDMATAAYVAA